MRPPDSLMQQLSVYTEEKFEDEEDLRERSLSLAQKAPTSSHLMIEVANAEDVTRKLISQAEGLGILPDAVEMLERCSDMLQRIGDSYVSVLYPHPSDPDFHSFLAVSHQSSFNTSQISCKRHRTLMICESISQCSMSRVLSYLRDSVLSPPGSQWAGEKW